jgi:hypothetical protein
MTKYYINDEEVKEDDFKSQLEEDTREEQQEAYDEALDEGGEVNIGGLTYNASYVLKQVDEVAYRCGFNDYIDGILTDYNDDLEQGEELTINNNAYRIEEE